MTIHITDIPNESFNHYKHVLHVDNEFALMRYIVLPGEP